MLELCRRTLDDASRGAADIERILLAADAERLETLLAQSLPDAPDPDLALIHLERYSREGALPSDPETFQILITLFGFSPYLAEALINDRPYLPQLVRARRQGASGVEGYRGELARWLRIHPGEETWDALRTFKRRANMRIAARDLQRTASLPEICREISASADALIQCGLEIVLADLTERYGRPQAFDETGRIVPSVMTVIALGKLGGMELNYSSDIDLLFVYSKDGETSGRPGDPDSQIANKLFFTKTAEQLALGLSQISREGQVYRVDCRLRPGGRDGDLVTALQAALVYYQSWARPWERQALIKARPCAGDTVLGALFLSGIQPIVYCDPPDPAAVENIRDMKDLIDADLARRRGVAIDLKLGLGGIREIEFTVQAYQLLHGAADHWIQEANTLLALHRLTDKGYLSIQEYSALSAAYTFLREVEHRVQIHRNLQRSTLPAAHRDLRVLARSIGYRDNLHHEEVTRFLADLEAHRQTVRGIYDAALGTLSQSRLTESPQPDPFLDPVTDIDTLARLESAGIQEPSSLLGGVKQIARLLDPAATTQAIRREFRRVTPVLLSELGRVHNPVRALRNFGRYLASLGLDRARLADFLQRRELLAPVMRLFAGSQMLSGTLINRPGLVLEGGVDAAVARERTVGEHVAHIMEAYAACAGHTEFSAFLRVYHRSRVLYIGLSDLSLQTGPAGVARALSDLADAILRATVASCARQVGWPILPGGDGTTTPGFLILGLGKLGYREMDYSTDLDLVFLYETGPERVAQRHADANQLAGMIVETLASMTNEGSLYAVDTRLRPFGQEGELAQPVERLQDYFGTTAAVWEMQSFLKARPVAGDRELAWRTQEELESYLFARARQIDLAAAVQEMKSRLEQEAASRGGGTADIKHGPGGLIAIQFAIQFLQLTHGIPSPPHKRTTRLLATLRQAGVLDEEAHESLFTGYRFLRALEHQLRLIHGRALTRLPESKEAVAEIAWALGYRDDGDSSGDAASRLLADLDRHREMVETAFRRVVRAAAPPSGAPSGMPLP